MYCTVEREKSYFLFQCSRLFKGIGTVGRKQVVWRRWKAAHVMWVQYVYSTIMPHVLHSRAVLADGVVISAREIVHKSRVAILF